MSGPGRQSSASGSDRQPEPQPEPSIGAWLLGAGAAAIAGIAAAGGPVKAAEKIGGAAQSFIGAFTMTAAERERERREQEQALARELAISEAARENDRLNQEALRLAEQRKAIEERERLRVARQNEAFNREKERQAALDLAIEQQKTIEKEATLKERAEHAAPITSNDIEDDLLIVRRNLRTLVFSPVGLTLQTAPLLKLKLNQIQLRGVDAKRGRVVDPFGEKSLDENVFNFVPQRGDKTKVRDLIDNLVNNRHDLRNQAQKDYRQNLERLFVDAFQYGYQTGEQPSNDNTSAAYKAGIM